MSEILKLFFVTGVKSDCWSTSWKASFPSCSDEIAPASETTGEKAALACANPVTVFVAPGPA